MSLFMKYLGTNEPLAVIIGPSGTGKSLIVTKLIDEGLIELTPTWTDRPLRQDEQGALDHKFASTKEIMEVNKQNKFLEAPLSLFGDKYLYAMPRVTHQHKERVPVVMIRIMVLDALRKHYPNIVIYQIDCPKKIARERMTGRGSDKETIERRLNTFDEEVKNGRLEAKRVFDSSEDVDKILLEIKKALKEDFKIN